jgi:flagellar biosynthesis anti-sigma factor FlgM
MRIDLNLAPQPLPETTRSNTPNSGKASNSSGSIASGAAAEDQAQLSGSHTQVLALVAQASRLPEVREERIHILQQAIQSGQYQSIPEKVAGALFAHLIAGSAA